MTKRNDERIGPLSDEKVDIPAEGQPLGKDYPFEEAAVTSEERGRLVDGSNAYENSGATNEEAGDRGAERRGPFDVPDDDLSGEGWVPPTSPGGGWEHPVETSLEERLEETEGLEEEGVE